MAVSRSGVVLPDVTSQVASDVASMLVVFGRYGFPPTLARKAYHAFSSTTPNQGANLNKRLFSLSGNGRTEQFHTAWQQVTDHPVLGGGAGSFDGYWFQHRRVNATVHDAHNLYLETLAELGPPGLILLVLVFGLPLAALRRARSSPLAAVTWQMASSVNTLGVEFARQELRGHLWVQQVRAAAF